MTESKHSLDDLPALMDERRKYESWLAALEARRDVTPAHVFDRVKGDYLARLQGVEEQLVAHRHAIEEERANSQSRLSILAADEQLRRDERAELELRSHVGELEGPDAETAFKNIDSTLRVLLDEEKSVNDRIAELNALLNFKSVEKTPAEPVLAQAPSAAPASAPAAGAPNPPPTNDGGKATRNTPGGTFDELAFLSEVVGEEERRAAQSARTDQVAPPAAGPAKSVNSAGTGNAAAPHPVPAALAAAPLLPGASAPLAKPVAVVNPLSVTVPPPPVAVPPRAAAPLAAAPAPMAAATASPLVETENGADSREPLIPRRPSFLRKEDSASLLDGIENAPRRSSRDIPLAANVASNTPIVLKAAGAVEQSKTLKCTECGAMNYPTEWYCERCGAELAAL